MGDKEQVISALRATLISVKGALTIKQCNRKYMRGIACYLSWFVRRIFNLCFYKTGDFKELQGEWIPFKRLGYPSLEKLFQDVPGFKVKEINGEWYVDAIASQETQHIATMVAKQKSSKKTGPKLNYPVSKQLTLTYLCCGRTPISEAYLLLLYTLHYLLLFLFHNQYLQSRFPKRQDSWRTPAALSGNYKSNYNNQYSNQYYRAKGPPPRTYGYNSNPSFNKVTTVLLKFYNFVL